MKQTKLMMVVVVLFLSGTMVNAQSQTLTFKKGEVLDILLFNGKPEMGKLFPKYKETAFAFAVKMGYQPQPLFKVAETTQGGYQPSTFIFGKWPNIAARKKFLDEIVDNVPDFHEQRRAMWSTFYVSFYEMENDISFGIDPNKTVVATHLWKQDGVDFSTFQGEWLKEAKSQGAKVLLELRNPNSAVGYLYKPDYTVLLEWNDRASFDAFSAKYKAMELQEIQNINQFVIQ